MEEVGVKKESLGGEANDKKQGKNGEHAKINAKNDAQFPTRVDSLGLLQLRWLNFGKFQHNAKYKKCYGLWPIRVIVSLIAFNDH